MKTVDFSKALNNEVENVVENTKVSAAFVQELKEAFLMFPVRTDMRFKQSSKGELIISVTVVYATGMTQHFEGAGGADLISAIHLGMAKMVCTTTKRRNMRSKLPKRVKTKYLLMPLRRKEADTT